MKNIEIKILGAFFAVLIVIVVVAFWKQPEGTSREDVAIQLVIDSLKAQHAKQLTALEDSIQKAAYTNIALLEAEKNKYKAKASSAEKQLTLQNKTIAQLEQQYSAQCGELITEYRERHDTAMSIIRSKTIALQVCEATTAQWQTLAKSQDKKLQLAAGTIQEKDKTITTLKDRNTTITNRMDRNWLFRNWKWVRGEWREWVMK